MTHDKKEKLRFRGNLHGWILGYTERSDRLTEYMSVSRNVSFFFKQNSVGINIIFTPYVRSTLKCESILVFLLPLRELQDLLNHKLYFKKKKKKLQTLTVWSVYIIDAPLSKLR